MELKPQVNNIEIRQASADEVKAFYGGIRIREVIEAYGAFIDGTPVFMGGIMIDPLKCNTIFNESARLIGFFDVKSNEFSLGARSVLAIRNHMRRIGREIFVQCDEGSHKTAERLLSILGFFPTEEIERDSRSPQKQMRVWRWQP